MEIKAKEITLVDIDLLVENPKNNNHHPKEQIERLAKIIKAQGFRNPLTVSNRSGFVLCGHGRIAASKLAGLKQLPVIYQDFKDEVIKNESDLWHIKKDSKYVHPTQKPVELSVRAFGNHIKYLNVLDLFGGSGSTLIGAEQTGRKAYVMELDEKYCDVIINRWQNYTSKKAVLESTGQTYEELKNERE